MHTGEETDNYRFAKEASLKPSLNIVIMLAETRIIGGILIITICLFYSITFLQKKRYIAFVLYGEIESQIVNCKVKKLCRRERLKILIVCQDNNLVSF